MVATKEGELLFNKVELVVIDGNDVVVYTPHFSKRFSISKSTIMDLKRAFLQDRPIMIKGGEE